MHQPLRIPERSGTYCDLGVTVTPVVRGQIDHHMIG
jgi:hypothetical protein